MRANSGDSRNENKFIKKRKHRKRNAPSCACNPANFRASVTLKAARVHGWHRTPVSLPCYTYIVCVVRIKLFKYSTCVCHANTLTLSCGPSCCAQIKQHISQYDIPVHTDERPLHTIDASMLQKNTPSAIFLSRSEQTVPRPRLNDRTRKLPNNSTNTCRATLQVQGENDKATRKYVPSHRTASSSVHLTYASAPPPRQTPNIGLPTLVADSSSLSPSPSSCVG